MCLCVQRPSAAQHTVTVRTARHVARMYLVLTCLIPPVCLCLATSAQYRCGVTTVLLRRAVPAGCTQMNQLIILRSRQAGAGRPGRGDLPQDGLGALFWGYMRLVAHTPALIRPAHTTPRETSDSQHARAAQAMQNKGRG